VTSAVLIILVLWRVKLADVVSAVRRADYGYLALSLLALLSSYLLRALRWQYILWTIKRVRFSSAFRVYIISCMANNILPARMGELVRAFLAGKIEDISSSACLGAVAVERIFDVLILLFLLLGCGLLTSKLSTVGQVVWYVIGLAVGLVLGVYVLACWGACLLDWVRRIVGRFSNPLAEQISRLGQSFISGLQTVRDLQRFSIVLVTSIAVWLTVILEVRCALLAFDIQLPWLATAFVLSIAGLGIILPSSPGNVGTVEFFYVGALAIFQVNASIALSYALTLHTLDWMVITALGLIFLWQSGLSLRQMRTLTDKRGIRHDAPAIGDQRT
jgi:uncharacterized protein (TIRG00374 family)